MSKSFADLSSKFGQYLVRNVTENSSRLTLDLRRALIDRVGIHKSVVLRVLAPRVGGGSAPILDVKHPANLKRLLGKAMGFPRDRQNLGPALSVVNRHAEHNGDHPSESSV